VKASISSDITTEASPCWCDRLVLVYTCESTVSKLGCRRLRMYVAILGNQLQDILLHRHGIRGSSSAAILFLSGIVCSSCPLSLIGKGFLCLLLSIVSIVAPPSWLTAVLVCVDNK